MNIIGTPDAAVSLGDRSCRDAENLLTGQGVHKHPFSITKQGCHQSMHGMGVSATMCHMTSAHLIVCFRRRGHGRRRRLQSRRNRSHCGGQRSDCRLLRVLCCGSRR